MGLVYEEIYYKLNQYWDNIVYNHEYELSFEDIKRWYNIHYSTDNLFINNLNKNQIESLVESTATKYHDHYSHIQSHIKTVENFQTETDQLAENLNCFAKSLPQCFDYKLIDLYLKNYDQFESSEKLRKKIAFLDTISRLTKEHSPFNSEYSSQTKSGIINPAYILMGMKRLFMKILEQEPVFLGNPDPIFDMDEIVLHFFIIEDLVSLCEKINTQKNGGLNFSHINIHKLIALLIGHDITRYLSRIPNMDIQLFFFSYHHQKPDPVLSTKSISVSMLGETNQVTEPFMVREKKLQKTIFFENENPEHIIFNENFYRNYLNKIMKKVSRSSRTKKIYNVFFVRKGTFLNNDKMNPLNMKHPDVFFPSSGLAQLLNKKLHNILNDKRSFILESNNHHFLLASKDQDLFRPIIFNNELHMFMNKAREYFLNLITEDAIKFRFGSKE